MSEPSDAAKDQGWSREKPDLPETDPDRLRPSDDEVETGLFNLANVRKTIAEAHMTKAVGEGWHQPEETDG